MLNRIKKNSNSKKTNGNSTKSIYQTLTHFNKNALAPNADTLFKMLCFLSTVSLANSQESTSLTANIHQNFTVEATGTTGITNNVNPLSGGMITLYVFIGLCGLLEMYIYLGFNRMLPRFASGPFKALLFPDEPRSRHFENPLTSNNIAAEERNSKINPEILGTPDGHTEPPTSQKSDQKEDIAKTNLSEIQIDSNLPMSPSKTESTETETNLQSNTYSPSIRNRF